MLFTIIGNIEIRAIVTVMLSRTDKYKMIMGYLVTPREIVQRGT